VGSGEKRTETTERIFSNAIRLRELTELIIKILKILS